MKPIYLDHAATSPLLPEVLEIMLPYLTQHYGNPSSLHSFGRTVRGAIVSARDSIAGNLGCESKELIFTSGGTESDNLALFGTARIPPGKKNHIITSPIEHHAVLHTCRQLENSGYEVTYLPVDRTGLISVEDLKAAIRPETLLITLMYGNNEVGTIQPVEEIGALAKEAGVFFHVDAVQALGTIPIKLSGLPVDMMSFAAHKIGGPKGTGALYYSSKTSLSPILFGGSQERKKRAGTENVAGIVGFAEAVRLAVQSQPEKRRKLEHLRSRMIDALKEQLDDSFTVNGHPKERLPHILNVSFPGTKTETVLMNLDLEGIAASGGSACSSGSLELSHVLKAMGLSDDIASSAIRFSFGSQTTEEDVLTAAKKVGTIVNRLRNK